MSTIDKIRWIKNSSHGRKIVGDDVVSFYTEEKLNSVIRKIGQQILKESEALADAYIHGK